MKEVELVKAEKIALEEVVYKLNTDNGNKFVKFETYWPENASKGVFYRMGDIYLNPDHVISFGKKAFVSTEKGHYTRFRFNLIDGEISEFYTRTDWMS